MSITAKKMLTNSIQDRLRNTLTVAQMEELNKILSDELTAYDIESTNIECPHGLDLLQAFLQSKSMEGRSEKTVERYRYVLTKVFKSIGVPETRTTVYHIRDYLNRERNRGISESTLEGYRSILCSYFGWLHNETLIIHNPCINLGPIRCPKVVKLPYSDVEIEKLKEVCYSPRDKALVCFLLSTGCRIGEVIQLNRDDVDYQGMQCKVLGKGNKERVVYIDNITRMNMMRYERSRSDTSNALFAGKGSDRMTAGGIRKTLKTLEEKSGVENVHPHRFRRTLATNLINRGMPIQEVARILGHDRLDTTMKYIYINDMSVKAAYQKYA